MPPKGVSKRCPLCNKQLPVATRHCACGHQFFEERRRSSTAQDSASTDADEAPQRHHISIDKNNIHSEVPTTSTLMSSKNIAGASSSEVAGKRRSERVKREKPNFYDALEYDNQMRKARKERQKDDPQPHSSSAATTTSTGRAKRERRPKNSSHDEEEDDEPVVKEKKRRKKKKKVKKEEEEDDEDVMAGISPYRERCFAFVLADINMKLGLNNPAFLK